MRVARWPYDESSFLRHTSVSAAFSVAVVIRIIVVRVAVMIIDGSTVSFIVTVVAVV